MIISREREKLLNAIIYFVRNTKHCHTLKLFKLLNFFDFEHYRQTGRTVTGLTYKAWEKGPVPTALYHEISKSPQSDLLNAVSIAEDRDMVTDRVTRREIKPKVQFDSAVFTARELAIMERLSEFFRDFRAENMSEFSHMKGLPWRRVFGKGEGKGKPIPPDLALEADPIVAEAPTIDADELTYRKEILRGLS